MNKKHISALVILIIVVVAVTFIKSNSELSQKNENQNATVSTEAQNLNESQPQTAEIPQMEFITDLPFSFPEYPGINFKITKITRTYDPKADYNYSARGIDKPVLVTVELQIDNDGNKKLNANFIQFLYEVNDNSDVPTRIAPKYIHTSYETTPLSSIKVSPTFILPYDRENVSLVVGIYPPIDYESAEDLLSRSVDAFLVDFKQQKVSPIEG